jgi:hypothetical protein
MSPQAGEGENAMSPRSRTMALTTLGLVSIAVAGWSEPVRPDVSHLVAGGGGRVWNRGIEAIEKDGQPAVSLDEREGDGLAYWPDLRFRDGTVELDVRGRDLPGRSFVGLAFHGLDEETYDVVYFRPFNFRAEDPERRAHAVQYISHPEYTWNRLRSEHPGTYEKPLDPPPDPEGWLHVRIVVAHPRLSVFVNGADTPSLEVEQLSDRGEGWVGFWVGNGSNGEFANLELTPSE